MTDKPAWPECVPMHTWISYQLFSQDEKAWKVSGKRVYHSAAALAGGVIGGLISLNVREHSGTRYRSVVIHYGITGATVEPIASLADVLSEGNPALYPQVGKKIIAAIEGWHD